jgi:hypothetical protein
MAMPYRISSIAEKQALPEGSYYRTPDGTLARVGKKKKVEANGPPDFTKVPAITPAWKRPGAQFTPDTIGLPRAEH